MSANDWTYETFYFGSAVYPSDAQWRTHKETGERQYRFIFGEAKDVYQARAWWRGRKDPLLVTLVDPHLVPIRDYYFMAAWGALTDAEAAERAYTRDKLDAMGQDHVWDYDAVALTVNDEQ